MRTVLLSILLLAGLVGCGNGRGTGYWDHYGFVKGYDLAGSEYDPKVQALKAYYAQTPDEYRTRTDEWHRALANCLDSRPVNVCYQARTIR
jgi:hypothetical protein